MRRVTASRESSAHIDSLDGLRSLGASIVLIGHTFIALSKPQALTQVVVYSPLLLLINGYGAVHMFFVLSGFVLAASADRCRDGVALGQFYVRRVFRIHPPYLIALLFAWLMSFGYESSRAAGGLTPWMLALADVHLSPGELWPYLLFPSEASDQLSAAWSMKVEMIFSLAMPLMMWIARRSHWSVLLAITAIPHVDPSLKPGFLKYAICFATGIAIAAERQRITAWVGSLSAAGRGLFVLVTLVAFCGSSLALAHAPRLALPISALGGALLVVMALCVPSANRFLSRPALVYHGNTTYSFYLLHLPILTLGTRFISGPASWGEAALLVGVAYVLTASLGVASYQFVERPSIRAGNRVVRWISARTGRAAHVSHLTS